MFEADPAQLKYYFAAPTRYKGKGCVVTRTGYTGEDGLEVMVAKAQAVELADDLVARGAVPCGLGARDTLRLEAAMPLYGHELNETIDPIQAGLGWAVKLDKGDFIGRDALAAATQDAGKRPVRVGLEVEGKRAAREGSPDPGRGGRADRGGDERQLRADAGQVDRDGLRARRSARRRARRCSWTSAGR